MGYSTQAAKQALHQARGNLDDALKVLLSNPHMWWLQDADPENNSRQASPSQESINQGPLVPRQMKTWRRRLSTKSWRTFRSTRRTTWTPRWRMKKSLLLNTCPTLKV
ncbi:RIKEN cDNA 6330412F12, isoform CRA_a [Mus musculus]|nr:RIKEN cDNA 6330412F12, isoform CRA_a [Mus musculus]